MAQVKYLKHIGIAHLISKGNTKEIKLLYRLLGFQGKERNMFLTHNFIQIHPRRKDTLTPDILTFIEHVVEDHHAQIGHTDLINIREAHGKADIYVILIFHYRVDFTTDVTGSLVNFH